jgi:hypothetical protein
MNAVPNPVERPEDLLDAIASGEDDLGARLLRLAREAAAFDRASILDLLTDDSAAPADEPAPAPPQYDIRIAQGVRGAEAAR